MTKRKNNININYTTINGNCDKKDERISISENIIPILTFLITIFTASMTASKFIIENIKLQINHIYISSLITINPNEILAKIFIAIIASILFVFSFIVIKNKKNKKEALMSFLMAFIGTAFLNYEIFNNNNIIISISGIIFSSFILYVSLTKIESDNLLTDSISLGISIPITAVIIQIIFAIILPLIPFNNEYIIFAKEKNNTTEEFDKIVIYQDNEKSVLCDYNIEQQVIQTKCGTYQIIKNYDLIFKTSGYE